MSEQEKILGLIGIAKKAAFKAILEKVQAGKAVSADDRKFLSQYEEEVRAQESDLAASSNVHGRTEFANAREVAEYLKSQGWKISQASVYGHVKKGKLRPDEHGRFSMKAVHKYASMFLSLNETKQKIDEEDLARKKMVAEIARIEEQTKRERLKRMSEEGRLVPRDQFELELAARAAVIDTLRRNTIQTMAAERVAIVGGDSASIPNLIAYDMAAHYEEMNQYATTKEWHVLFSNEEPNEESDEGKNE